MATIENPQTTGIVRLDRCALVFRCTGDGAIAVSYFDRQTLPVAISAIQRTIPLSDQEFSWLQFAFLIPLWSVVRGGERMLHIVGTRRGFILTMVLVVWGLRITWSCIELRLFVGGPLLLGIGEGGVFPGTTRIVAEWVTASAIDGNGNYRDRSYNAVGIPGKTKEIIRSWINENS